MKLYSHNVVVPFDIDLRRYGHHQNVAVKAWWEVRRDWLERMGSGRWHSYRIPQAYTCLIDTVKPPPGNHNIDNVVLWSFEDPSTALMFKLAWA